MFLTRSTLTKGVEKMDICDDNIISKRERVCIPGLMRDIHLNQNYHIMTNNEHNRIKVTFRPI